MAYSSTSRKQGKRGCCPFPLHPKSPPNLPPLRSGQSPLTIPNTSSTITMPASLRSDCCSPSLRNAVRLPSGINVHLHRNTQLAAGLVLTHEGGAEMLTPPEGHGIIWQYLMSVGGVLLLIGFLTTMAGVLVVIVELWTALSRADNLRTCIVLAVVGAALAMLGPGIWSLDARLFGRKRIDIGDR